MTEATLVQKGEQSRVASVPRIAMVSRHEYVSAAPPLGAADTGGQVVYVLELSKKLAELLLRRHLDAAILRINPRSRKFERASASRRVPCGGPSFIPKEYLHEAIEEWVDGAALAEIDRSELHYLFVNSHYWDGGIAAHQLCQMLGMRHVHTPHSIGVWKQR